jgi:DNA-binding NarL/FixJ family response regulator
MEASEMTPASDKNKIKILIADDHPLFRRGLKNAISETPDIIVEAEVENGDDVLKIVGQKEFSLVVLDITMPGKNSIEVVKELHRDHPHLPVLILSVYPEEQYAVRFFKAGAAGYLTKESAADQLVEAVRKVASGGKFASAETVEKLAFETTRTDRQPHELLSDREYQVFCRIAKGQSLTDIGKDLAVSVKTISTHRARILDKMNMKKNAELIHYAISNDLL